MLYFILNFYTFQSKYKNDIFYSRMLFILCGVYFWGNQIKNIQEIIWLRENGTISNI